MNKYQPIVIVYLSLLVALPACEPKSNLDIEQRTSDNASVKDNKAYYTCPMHPEVHQDHPGNCPICHMKLVKIEQKVDEPRLGTFIQATDANLQMINSRLYVVSRKNLVYKISVSGRFQNSSTLAFQVYEEDLSKIKINAKVVGFADRDQNQILSAKIFSIDSYVDPASRTVRVLASLETNSKFPTESGFRGSIEIPMENSIAIPETAVLHTGKKDIAFKVNEKGGLQYQELRLGTKTEEYYEVLSGLEVGDKVTTGANFLLDSEAKIRGISND